MATFDVLSWLELYRSGEVESVTVQQPIPTGAYWTRTSNRDGGNYLYNDRSGLRPYTPCPLSSSLETGFPDKYIKKDPEGVAHVHLIMEALKGAGVAFDVFTFISFRNNINKICNTVLDNTSPWAMDGCILQEYPGTTFLNIQHTEERDYPDSERFCYYGHKFETLCTVEEDDAWVDETSEFAMVIETQLEGMKCAIAAEIDCYDAHQTPPTQSPSLSSLIELKTSRVESERQQKKIVVGYWSPDGTIRSIQSLRTQELPTRALDGFNGHMRNQVWRPDQILGFLHSVLEWMQGLLKMDMNRQYRFDYRPNQKLIVAEVVEDGDLVQQIRNTIGTGMSHQL